MAGVCVSTPHQGKLRRCVHVFAESKEAFSLLFLWPENSSLTKLLLYLCDSYPLTAYFYSEISQESYFCLGDDKIMGQTYIRCGHFKWLWFPVVAIIPQGLGQVYRDSGRNPEMSRRENPEAWIEPEEQLFTRALLISVAHTGIILDAITIIPVKSKNKPSPQRIN